MELTTNTIKYSTLFALLLFTKFIHAAPIPINWKFASNEEQQSIESFCTEIFTPQNGQRVYSYIMQNSAGWRRAATTNSAYRVSEQGDDLISVLVAALQGRRSQNEMREQAVSFEAFPIGWLHRTEQLSRITLDRVHFFHNDTAYVNLRLAREGSAPVAGSLSNTEDQSENHRTAKAEASVVNLAPDQDSAESQALSVVGVILQQVSIRRFWSQSRLFYLLIVTPQSLDDDSVHTILSDRAKGYFCAYLSSETLDTLIAPFTEQLEQSPQVSDISSEASHQETAMNYFRMFVNYVALLCCCRCLTSRIP